MKSKDKEKEYVIWGAGRVGEAAYIYYKNYVNILFYVDSDQKKWNTVLNGIPIYSPDVLKKNKKRVIIALKEGHENISNVLETEYQISDYTEFSFVQTNHQTEKKEDKLLEEESVIICCSGGLGNQMFQYALYRNLQEKKKNTYIDISCYNGPFSISYQLQQVFPNLKVRICSDSQRNEYVISQARDFFNLKDFQIYVEPSLNDEPIKKFNSDLFDISSGIIKGNHLCYQYAEEIRNIMLQEFSFLKEIENSLKNIMNHIRNQNSVSIHVRRGDYLGRREILIYGNICTAVYYDKAIEEIKRKIDTPVFYFFSNDIEWAKENFNIPNAIYIEENMFEHYEDWYDMFLMSICKHNIIANSTFSWWGAWLNQNPDKIVIAPKKWNNISEYQDICPLDWVRI